MIGKLIGSSNKKKIAEMQESAEKQKAIAERMSNVSDNIITYYNEADGYVKQLSNAIDTSNSSMQDIAQSIEHTSKAIQEQSHMCVAIQNNTQDAKAQAELMEQASQKTHEEVESGAKAMKELRKNAQNVEKDNQETVKYIKALNEGATKVNNILATIVSISAQTNLLALNASIEAARAGEAGKGFAVVAEEIRVLSEQTKNATENIKDILDEFDENVASVTASVGHSVEIAAQQNALIEETGAKFAAIDNGVGELVQTINNMKKLIDEINDSSVVIAKGITELSAGSQQVAAVSNEGAELMTGAVDNMDKVNKTLANIYGLANELKQ